MDSRDIASSRRETWLASRWCLCAAVGWSTMGLFVRMMPGVDVWTVVFWRSIFGGLSIIVLAMVERRRLSFEWRRTLTAPGMAITVLIASGVFASIYSMQNTTIANGCVINATAPFMTAVLAWLWFRERPGATAIICTFIAMTGVAITVSGTIASGGGHLKGDLAMVYGTFALAMTTVIMRRYRDTPMLESVAIACLVAAAFASLFAKPFAIPGSDMLLLGLFGVVTQGGGLGLYMMGARRLPSAQAALLTRPRCRWRRCGCGLLQRSRPQDLCRRGIGGRRHPVEHPRGLKAQPKAGPGAAVKEVAIGKAWRSTPADRARGKRRSVADCWSPG